VEGGLNRQMGAGKVPEDECRTEYGSWVPDETSIHGEGAVGSEVPVLEYRTIRQYF